MRAHEELKERAILRFLESAPNDGKHAFEISSAEIGFLESSGCGIAWVDIALVYFPRLDQEYSQKPRLLHAEYSSQRARLFFHSLPLPRGVLLRPKLRPPLLRRGVNPRPRFCLPHSRPASFEPRPSAGVPPHSVHASFPALQPSPCQLNWKLAASTSAEADLAPKLRDLRINLISPLPRPDH